MTNKLRVCFLAPLWKKGVHVRGWIEELAQRGVDCYSISDSDGNGLPDFNYLADPNGRLRLEKIRHALANPKDVIRGKLLGSDFAWLFQGRRILRRLKDWEVHVLHAHYLDPFAILAGYVGFTPWLASAWGSDLAKIESDKEAARRASWALSKADFIHVETQRQARILEFIGVPKERLLVRNWGVRTDVFRPGRGDVELRSRLGIRRGEVVLISLRAHEQHYCIDVLLKAVAHLSRSRPRVRLIIGSSGSETPSLQSLAKQLGIQDRVCFVGDVPHSSLPDYFRLADIYVQAPLMDGVSYTLLEAMSSGLPVVTTGTGDTPENVHDGQNGLFFPAGRPDILAEKVGLLTRNAAARRRMGRRTREWVLKNCDRKSSFDFFLSKYQGLVES